MMPNASRPTDVGAEGWPKPLGENLRGLAIRLCQQRIKFALARDGAARWTGQEFRHEQTSC